MAQGTEVVIYEDGEWSGVYLDGKLQRVGDTYLADEWVREHFGVVTIQSADYMRGATCAARRHRLWTRSGPTPMSARRASSGRPTSALRLIVSALRPTLSKLRCPRERHPASPALARTLPLHGTEALPVAPRWRQPPRRGAPVSGDPIDLDAIEARQDDAPSRSRCADHSGSR